jgi:serine/threonine-protein kinase HipA
MNSKESYVFIDLDNKTVPVGKLWGHFRSGRESASFEYDKNWLNNSERFAIDPALQLTKGTFHTANDSKMFGAIGDSAPDRWGRVLMRRAESRRAKDMGKTPHTLMEMSYLLGVSDEARQGALRFSENPEGPFLAIADKNNIPPLIDLPKLLSATENFLDSNESAEDLKLLLIPGSSLGGARPKASIRDRDGSLAIAKFPRKDDDYNVVIWEAVILTLAKNAGITVPNWHLKTVINKQVLIVKRFDRCGVTRIPFLSAMSMLGAADNEQHSYLEIVYALAQNGANPIEDMCELWRRIVFTILVSNTDDHLRNHGFLYERNKGWRLSPAYDINPTPIEMKPRVLSTAIDLSTYQASLDVALSVIPEFRISKDKAVSIIKEVSKAVSKWNQLAKSFGLNETEIERMSSAFEHEDTRKALSFAKAF